jgi:Protein of unknown function (DUF1569)
MKHLFEPARAEEVKQRLEQLQPGSQRQWGNMDPAQMLAHCSAAIDMAEGKIVSPRIMIGRLLGPLAKKSLIIKGEPMRRNSKTAPSVLITDQRDFIVEKKRLLESVDRFVAGGPAICTGHPHFFFGPLTPEEWASLMYQHLDHHLRQFGA